MAIQKTTIPCADVKMYTQETLMQVSEWRKGMLHMVNDYLLEFVEEIRESCTRNPKAYRGDVLNVGINKDGGYQVHFRRMVLTRGLNPHTIARMVEWDLRTAKKQLGL